MFSVKGRGLERQLRGTEFFPGFHNLPPGKTCFEQHIQRSCRERYSPYSADVRSFCCRFDRTPPMSNPGDFAYTVKQQADIVRVIGEYLTLKKAGAQNYSGLCPFHQEKTPSFSVQATRQFYHCFGCGASGDVLSFVQKIENVTFPEAVRLVAQKVGVPPPKQTYSSPQEAREARMRGALLDMHEQACAFFEEQLRRPEGARA